MKKVNLALVSAALLVATNVQAGWQGNWLLGVSAGGAWHSGDDDFDLTVAVAPFSETFVLSNDNDDGDFIWGFLAGYQARCNRWLFGAEVNVDWRGDDDDEFFAFNSPDILGDGVTGTISRDNDPVVGLTARMGYEVSPFFMPYIRLGVDFGGRDADFTLTTSALGAQNFTLTASSDDDRWGFVGGIGAEFPVPVIAGLSLRAEWDYHSRRHHNDDIVVLGPDNATLFTFNNEHRHEQTARASLVFNFPA